MEEPAPTSCTADSAWDEAAYWQSDEAITVDLGTGIARGGHAEGDTYTSIESIGGSRFGDVLTGNAERNFIWGDHGDDVINGGDGDDALWGHGGADTLTGGAGDDLFIYDNGAYESTGDEYDTITDFSSGDRIELGRWFEQDFEDISQTPTADGLMVEAGDLKVLLAGFDGMLTEADFLLPG